MESDLSTRKQACRQRPLLTCCLPVAAPLLPGRAPLYKVMEEQFERTKAGQEAARRAFYEEEVGHKKMATVSQLVAGEVHVTPPSRPMPYAPPERNTSPGEAFFLGCEIWDQVVAGVL